MCVVEWKDYLVDGIMVHPLALASWSLLKLLALRHQPWKRNASMMVSLRFSLPFLWEWLLPLGLFILLPQIQGLSWSSLILFSPDLCAFLAGISCLFLVTGGIKMLLIVRRLEQGRRKPGSISLL